MKVDIKVEKRKIYRETIRAIAVNFKHCRKLNALIPADDYPID